MDVESTSDQVFTQLIGVSPISAVLDEAATAAGELRCIELSLPGSACGPEAKTFILSEIQNPTVLAFRPLSSIPAIVNEWTKIGTLSGRLAVVQAQSAMDQSFVIGMTLLTGLHDALGLGGAYTADDAAAHLSHWSLTNIGEWSDTIGNGLISSAGSGMPWRAPNFLQTRDDEAAAAVVPGLDDKWVNNAVAWGIAFDGAVALEAASMVADAAVIAGNEFSPGVGASPMPPTAGPPSPSPTTKKTSMLGPALGVLGLLGLFLLGKKKRG